MYYGMKKRLGAALLAWSMFVNWCKDGDQKHTTNTHVPDLHAVLDMKIQKSDAAEFEAYTKTMDDYYLAQNYMDKHELSKFVVDFKEILPLYIKESRLDPSKVSKSGARWVAQMRDIAFEEVEDVIWDKKYSSIPNKYKDLVCSMIYYSHIKEVIAKKTRATDKSTIVHFTYAAYNLGIGNFLALYKKADNPSTWEGLVDEVTDILDISDSHTDIVDPSYNIANYTDWFGDKKFDENKSYTIDKKHVVPGSKLKETVRYVEVIDAMRQSLANNVGTIYDVVQVDDDKPYQPVLEHIKKLQEKGLVKEWNLWWLVHHIMVDNGITDHSPHIIRDTIEIDVSLIEPYLIDKEIQEFAYKRVDYSKWHYYRSILQEVLRTDTFSDILDIRQTQVYKSSLEEDNSDGEEDEDDIAFGVKQTIDEAIIYLNYARRSNYDLKNNEYLLLPSTEFVDRYSENRERLSPVVSKLIIADTDETDQDVEIEDKSIDVASGSIYANPTFDQFANRVLPAPNKTIKTHQFFNETLKKAKEANGVFKPQYIILHHTASMIDEDKKWHAKINAHFYVDRDGQIYQSMPNKWIHGNKKIYLESLPKLNHAGKWNGAYAALWDGDANITYKAIWIEIENSEKDHNVAITPAQYAALTGLLWQLSSTYNIPEKNIITHSMVWVTGVKIKNKISYRRWRKEDPWWFDYSKVGMKTDPFAQLDKDVMSGKVSSNIAYIKRDRQRRNTSINKNARNKIIEKMTYGLRVSEKKSKKK